MFLCGPYSGVVLTDEPQDRGRGDGSPVCLGVEIPHPSVSGPTLRSSGARGRLGVRGDRGLPAPTSRPNREVDGSRDGEIVPPTLPQSRVLRVGSEGHPVLGPRPPLVWSPRRSSGARTLPNFRSPGRAGVRLEGRAVVVRPQRPQLTGQPPTETVPPETPHPYTSPPPRETPTTPPESGVGHLLCLSVYVPLCRSLLPDRGGPCRPSIRWSQPFSNTEGSVRGLGTSLDSRLLLKSPLLFPPPDRPNLVSLSGLTLTLSLSQIFKDFYPSLLHSLGSGEEQLWEPRQGTGRVSCSGSDP